MTKTTIAAVAALKLSTNEVAVVKALATTEFRNADKATAQVPSFVISLVVPPTIVSKSIPGLMASLNKKGILQTVKEKGLTLVNLTKLGADFAASAQ